MELYSDLRAGEKGAWLSISTYLFLSAMKLFIGYIGASQALKADGLNNTTDIIASVAVLIGLRISQKPPDLNHRYGHLRAETVASVVASFIMLVVGLQVLSNSVNGLLHPIDHTPSMLTAIVALVSAFIMFFVYRFNLSLANKTKSSAIRAAAYDNRSDALVSIGTAIGIIGAIIGFPIIDVITALIVGLIIVKTAIEIFWEAVHTLTDGFDSSEVERFVDLIGNVNGVIRVIDLKGRTHGNMYLIDVIISVNPTLTVAESQQISESIKQTLKTFNTHCRVLVQIEPHALSYLS